MTSNPSLLGILVVGTLGWVVAACYQGPQGCDRSEQCFRGQLCDQARAECVGCEEASEELRSRESEWCGRDGGVEVGGSEDVSDGGEASNVFDTNCDGTNEGSPGEVDLPAPVAYWPFNGVDQGSFPNASKPDDEPYLTVERTEETTAIRDGKAGWAYELGEEGILASLHHRRFQLRNGTVMLWFRVPAGGLSKEREVLFAKEATGYGEGGHFRLQLDGSDEGGFDVRTEIQSRDEDDQVATEDGPYEPGRWHHVAVTFGEGGHELYVDGALTGRNPTWTYGWWGGPGDVRNREPVTIGVSREKSGSWTDPDHDSFTTGLDQFVGRIDEVAIFEGQHSPGPYVERCENGS